MLGLHKREHVTKKLRSTLICFAGSETVLTDATCMKCYEVDGLYIAHQHICQYFSLVQGTRKGAGSAHFQGLLVLEMMAAFQC